MKRLEVRCCCQPLKLLGWLPVADHVRQGDVIRFPIVQERWFLPSLEAAPVYLPNDVISLTVAEHVTSNAYSEEWPYVRASLTESRLAIKSEDTPMERLRLIRGFIENHDA